MVRRCLLSISFVLYSFVSLGWAEEPFRYPEGRYGPAKLKYHGRIPVMVVSGLPIEMAVQGANLLGKSPSRLLKFPRELLERFTTPIGARLLLPSLRQTGQRLYQNFPTDYRDELEHIALHGGFNFDDLVLANTLFDQKYRIQPFFQCSAVVVEKSRSVTGQPIFGRNMDFEPLGYLHEYTLVMVYKPKGKRAFASIGFPGSVGVISGINDAGLAVASLETTGAPPEQGPAFDETGVPFLLNYRRILEECASVDEAFKLLSQQKRTTSQHLVVCDHQGGAVIEYTPTRVVRRNPDNGTCRCTNHFTSQELKLAQPKNIFTTLDRRAKLEACTAGSAPIGVEEVKRYLNAVHQHHQTLQSMIFEPATFRLHLALAAGTAPASGQPYHTLDLRPLLDIP
jgi:predicted choloylglycine hydrolase